MSIDKLSFSLFDVENAQPITAKVALFLDGNELPHEQSEHTVYINPIKQDGRISIVVSGYTDKAYSIRELPKRINLIRDSIIGYADCITYEAGDSAKLFVNSTTEYTIHLFRHGENKERVSLTKANAPMKQEIPDFDFVSDGLGWKPTTTFHLPESSIPGLYSIQLENELSSFSFPLIVRTKTPTNKLLVLASETTWLAYNSWGGRSRYRNFIDYPEVVFSNSKAFGQYLSYIRGKLPLKFKVFLKEQIIPLFFGKTQSSTVSWPNKVLSWHRPIAYNGLDEKKPSEPFLNHLAAGEWRVLAWLEKKGFKYDYLPSSALEKEKVSSYDAIVLSTHNEYWSNKMYRELKRSNTYEKTWIINLSGNSINRAIEILDNGIRYINDFYKHVECESNLLGVRTTDADVGTASPYQVIDGNSWIWENTNLKTGDLFGKRTLNNKHCTTLFYNPGMLGSGKHLDGEGASGWETDKRTNLSKHSFKLLAKGKNFLGGAEMLLKETKGSCGGVFTTSSITFGGSLLIDEDCSHIAENVLKKALEP